MLYWLQTQFSQSGFWTFMAVVAALVIATAVTWRRPLLKGEPDNDPVTILGALKVLACVVVALAVWWAFAHLIGGR